MSNIYGDEPWLNHIEFHIIHILGPLEKAGLINDDESYVIWDTFFDRAKKYEAAEQRRLGHDV